MAIPYRDRGRDRRGCDCYGIYRLILKERLGIDLPVYDHLGVDDFAAVEREQAPLWVPVPEGEEALYDLAVMRAIQGLYAGDFHMGMVTAPGWVFHVERGTGAAHLPFTHPSVRGRIRRIYRHRTLA